MLFIAFYVAAQISISDVHIHLKKTTFYRNRAFIILYTQYTFFFYELQF